MSCPPKVPVLPAGGDVMPAFRTCLIYRSSVDVPASVTEVSLPVPRGEILEAHLYSFDGKQEWPLSLESVASGICVARTGGRNARLVFYSRS